MSTAAETVSVELAFALPEVQECEALLLPYGTTARDALSSAGLPARYPEHINIYNCPLGVWGKQVADHYVLKDGDRLEIYRPLINEPRETRRRLAAEGKTMGSKSR